MVFLMVLHEKCLIQTCLTHTYFPPRANGEPLFSSHMLDLSEEFDEENIATCVKYFKVLWSCPNCPSIGDPDIVQFHTCGRDITGRSVLQKHCICYCLGGERRGSGVDERRKWERVNAL